MGRFQLASHQSKQQKMLDRCALTCAPTCCLCMNYSVEARIDSGRPALPWVMSIYMPSWSGVNMQEATGNVQHAHDSFLCVQGMPLRALLLFALQALALVLGHSYHASMCQGRRLGCRWWRGRSSGSSGGGSGTRGRAPSMMLSLSLKMSSLAGNSPATSEYQCIKDDCKSAYALLLELQLL